MTNVFKNITIANRNSFHVDVTAQTLIEYSSESDLSEIFHADNRPSKWLVVSGGNNILFTRDVEECILTPTAQEITIVNETQNDVNIRIEAGAEWDDVVEWCVNKELWGAENLSLIPGKAGAAPIQNIGAYGCEVCDILTKVDYFDTKRMEHKTIMTSDCQFAYRDSIFKRELKGRAIVTAIYLRLSKLPNPQLHYADLISRISQRGEPTLRTIREVICEIRREKLPDTNVMGNAGSFFKNPIVESEKAQSLLKKYPSMPLYAIEGDTSKAKLAAGWLIDQVGMKGYTKGRVGVHSRQALVLVNLGGATGGEIIELAHEVQRAVKEQFDVEIETEVNIY